MRIAITGGTGLVGTRLCEQLRARGDEVQRITRSARTETDIEWNPQTHSIERDKLEGLDALINLAGDNIAKGRWNRIKRERIRNSRVETTRFLVDSLATLDAPPPHLISASAIGFYGHRGDEWMTETSRPGEGFLSETCVDWEEAGASAESIGLKVAHGRIGVVLTTEGGALQKLLGVFRLGLGGRFGSGRQFWSWIGIDDLAKAFCFLLDEQKAGVWNLVDDTCTNREFTQHLAQVLKRPAFLPVPGVAVQTLMGEMGFELLLASTRVSSQKIRDAGFQFSHQGLPMLLESLVGDK